MALGLRAAGDRFFVKFAWSRPAALRLAREIGGANRDRPRAAGPVPAREMAGSSADPLLMITRRLPGTSPFEVAGPIDPDHAARQLVRFRPPGTARPPARTPRPPPARSPARSCRQPRPGPCVNGWRRGSGRISAGPSPAGTTGPTPCVEAPLAARRAVRSLATTFTWGTTRRWWALEFTTSAEFRLTDAENGSQYYIKVTALNAAGEGPGTPVTSVIPVPHAVPTRPVAPSGLTARVSHRSVTLSWSQPGGGTKVSDYLVYVGTRPVSSFTRSFDEVPDPRVHTYTVTGLPAGARYYFRVLAVGAKSVSLPSNETSVFLGAGTCTGTAAGSGTISVSSSGVVTESGAGHGQPSAAPRPGTELAQDSASSGPPTGLVVLLVALVLAAAAGGATAVMLLRRRRYDRPYGSVPAPRRPHDDQPAGQSSRTEEMNGPRYR